jgi:hypothetical protein
MDREAASDQHDRAGGADLEYLGDAVPGDRGHRACLVRQHDSQEVLAVALLAAFALADDEGPGHLVAVAELAKQPGFPRVRRSAAAAVVKKRLRHPVIEIRGGRGQDGPAR